MHLPLPLNSSYLRLITFTSLFFSLCFCVFSIDESFLAQHYFQQYYGSKQDALKLNVLDKGEAIIELLSFGYLGNVSDERATREEQLQMAQHHSKRSIKFTSITLGITTVSLGILLILSKGLAGIFFVAGGMHCTILLIAGVLCPMLEINYIYNEAVPIHVSKSIFDTIYTTYEHGPIFLSFILLLCSFFIPLLKCLDLCFFPWRANHKFVIHLAFISKILGKWSMADVFVVAILVSYFVPTGIQSKGGGYSESYLKSGFYFFLCYCIISLVINQISYRKSNLVQ